MKDFWQAPGSSKLFNTPLKYWNDTLIKDTSSIRSIAVLKFINDNPGITVTEFKDYFINYFDEFSNCLDLNQKIDLIKNKKKGNPHSFKVLLFCNFISVSSEDEFLELGKYTETKGKDKLKITDSGERFLNELKQENYEAAINIYLNNLFEIKYPNKSTPKVRLTLYPYRIMFKLLSSNNLHNGFIPRKMFITDIPFINYDNYKNIYDKLADDCYLSNLERLNYKNIEESYGHKYRKWNMWVVSSLIDMGILEESGGYVSLANYKKDFIQSKVDNFGYEDCFF